MVTDSLRGIAERADVALSHPHPAAKVARGLTLAVAFLVIQQAYFGAPLSLVVFGVSLGSLYGLLAVGIILIYRSAQIINFAAAAIGAVPAIFALLLQVHQGWSYWLAFPLAIVGSLAMGAIVDFCIIRRFAQAPRLILTVATIGISQILAFISIYIPRWLGSNKELQSVVPTPWKQAVQVDYNGRPLLTGDYLFAIVMVGVIALALAAFFRFTRMGIAVRASAENADRASLLGIPVRRVGTVAWALAGLLAGMGIFLRAPLVGVPVDGTLGYSVLVYALAAAVIARMERLWVAIFAGMAVGIIEQGSVFKTGASSFSTALMLALILGALLLQRRSLGRAHDTGTSTWQSVQEFRGIPAELRNVREVRIARTLILAAVAALALGAPYLVGDARVDKLTLIPMDAMVAVSLVILVGWAGQISLGQFGIVGIAAGIVGGFVANHNLDFWAAIIIGALIGAAVAVLIGLPALRVQGLYLAVTTLAFAAAVEGYFLRPDYVGARFLPSGLSARIERPILWERVNVQGKHAFYYLTLAFLLGVILAARAFRRNRSGRVLIAVRDNQRAAPAYAINLARSKLAAFAVSGAIAAIAGVLNAYQQGQIDYAAYGMTASIAVFVYTVVGGLTSVAGGVMGAVVFGVIRLFGEDLLRGLSFFATGVGVLVVLLFKPGGLAEIVFGWRDKALTWVANRHGILVPSLVADRRVEDADEEHVIESAEKTVEERVEEVLV